MTAPYPENYIVDMVADHDRKNLDAIEAARAAGRINDDAAAYLSRLYSDRLKWYREVFYFLGKCFGAPKAPVTRYNYATDSAIDEPLRISDIHPLSCIIVWTLTQCEISSFPARPDIKLTWRCRPLLR